MDNHLTSSFDSILNSSLKTLLHLVPAETAHTLAIFAMKHSGLPRKRFAAYSTIFARNVMGLKFSHPICLAAGFDKNAEAFNPLSALGFAAVEVGSITRFAQPGNKKPRVFRLPEHQSIINRYGFNSKGSAYVADRLNGSDRLGILGVNFGLNKDSVSPEEDFEFLSVQHAAAADYVVINVSSPNTPNLRSFLEPAKLDRIIQSVRRGFHYAGVDRPLVIKLSPDLDTSVETELMCFLNTAEIDGVIATNTTSHRDPGFGGRFYFEPGGLSGALLRPISGAFLARLRQRLSPRISIIASGGIMSGDDAYQCLTNGADLVQIYTSMIFRGHLAPRFLLNELHESYERDKRGERTSALQTEHGR